MLERHAGLCPALSVPATRPRGRCPELRVCCERGRLAPGPVLPGSARVGAGPWRRLSAGSRPGCGSRAAERTSGTGNPCERGWRGSPKQRRCWERGSGQPRAGKPRASPSRGASSSLGLRAACLLLQWQKQLETQVMISQRKHRQYHQQEQTGMEMENLRWPQTCLSPVPVAGGPVTALSQHGFPSSPVGLQLLGFKEKSEELCGPRCSTSLVGCADVRPRGPGRSW